MALVKLFKTPNAVYSFDVSTSSLREINGRELQRIEASRKGRDSTYIVEDNENMENGGNTASNEISEISHPGTRILSTLLDRKVSQITLQLTQQCNFRCSYCIYSCDKNTRQRTHSDKQMSIETAKRAVDFLWEHSVDSPSVNVGFYGGEPLLKFDLISEVAEYAKSKFEGKQLTFNMTTNGSLLSPSIIDFLAKNDLNLLISLDGPKSIHDKNRKFKNGAGTFDLVLKNIRQLKERHPEYWETVHYSMVVDPRNDFEEISSICNYDEIKPENILFTIVDEEYDGHTAEFSEKYVEQIEYQIFLAYLSYWGIYQGESLSPLIKSKIDSAMADRYKIEIMSPIHTVDAPSGPCLPGIQRLFADVNGNLFPCERVSETSSLMNIGDIYSGFDLEKALRILNISQLTPDECKACWCFRLCGQCAKKADIGNDEFSKEARLHFCQQSKSSAYSKVMEYLMSKEIPHFYKQYIRCKDEQGG